MAIFIHFAGGTGAGQPSTAEHMELVRDVSGDAKSDEASCHIVQWPQDFNTTYRKGPTQAPQDLVEQNRPFCALGFSTVKFFR